MKLLFIVLILATFVGCSSQEEEGSPRSSGVDLLGSESSSGGGDTLHISEELIQKNITKTFEIFKANPEKASLVLFAPMTYLYNLNNIKSLNDVDCANQQCVLSQKIDSEKVEYLKAWNKVSEKYSVDLSRGEKGNYLKIAQILQEKLTSSKINFNQCLQVDASHKKAYYHNNGVSHIFCFKSRELVGLGVSDVREQMISLVVHELIHSLGFGENEAEAIHKWTYRYYSKTSQEPIVWRDTQRIIHLLTRFKHIIRGCGLVAEIAHLNQGLSVLLGTDEFMTFSLQDIFSFKTPNQKKDYELRKKLNEDLLALVDNEKKRIGFSPYPFSVGNNIDESASNCDGGRLSAQDESVEILDRIWTYILKISNS